MSWFLRAAREPLETAAIIVGLVVAWELAVWVFKIPRWLVPAPSEIWTALSSNPAMIGKHLAETATGAVLGLLTGIVAGVSLAIFMANFQVVERFVFPLLLIDQSIPKVALAPLFIIWFGSGMASRVVMVVVVAFLPIVITTLTGLASIDPRIRDLMRTLSAGRKGLLLKVQLPNAVPYIFSGIKIATPLSIIGAVVAEFLQSDKGLGYLIVAAVSQYDTPLIFVAIVLMSLLSLTIFAVVRMLETALLRRRYSYVFGAEDAI
jgi:NitT/TauT family transport system permease protein